MKKIFITCCDELIDASAVTGAEVSNVPYFSEKSGSFYLRIFTDMKDSKRISIPFKNKQDATKTLEKFKIDLNFAWEKMGIKKEML